MPSIPAYRDRMASSADWAGETPGAGPPGSGGGPPAAGPAAAAPGVSGAGGSAESWYDDHAGARGAGARLTRFGIADRTTAVASEWGRSGPRGPPKEASPGVTGRVAGAKAGRAPR